MRGTVPAAALPTANACKWATHAKHGVDLPSHMRATHSAFCTHPDLLAEPDVELVQNMSCKVDAATLKPAEYPAHPEMEW